MTLEELTEAVNTRALKLEKLVRALGIDISEVLIDGFVVKFVNYRLYVDDDMWLAVPRYKRLRVGVSLHELENEVIIKADRELATLVEKLQESYNRSILYKPSKDVSSP